MDRMFYLDSGLVEVDLSSFDTSKVENMNQMFQ
jgi:surface protein